MKKATIVKAAGFAIAAVTLYELVRIASSLQVLSNAVTAQQTASAKSSTQGTSGISGVGRWTYLPPGSVS
jgi:hypothetical protein